MLASFSLRSPGPLGYNAASRANCSVIGDNEPPGGPADDELPAAIIVFDIELMIDGTGRSGSAGKDTKGATV